MNFTTYQAMRPKLQTLDVVGFHGKQWTDRLIQVSGFYSHVGLVVRGERPSQILMWESTTVSDAQPLEGQDVRGVQTCFLSERIQNCLNADGRVVIRQIQADRTDEVLAALEAFRLTMAGTPYEKNWLQLILSALPGGKEGAAKLGSVFCSELVVAALQAVGWASKSLQPSDYTPTDVMKRTPLVGATWRDPVEIVR